MYAKNLPTELPGYSLVHMNSAYYTGIHLSVLPKFRHEVKLLRYGGLLWAVTSVISFSAVIQLVMGVTFLSYTGSGQELTAQIVFTTLSLVNNLHLNSGGFLIRAFFGIYDSTVAVKRIQVHHCCYYVYYISVV